MRIKSILQLESIGSILLSVYLLHIDLSFQETFVNLTMVSLQSCSIGEFQGSLCHKTFYSRGKIGLLQASQLLKEDIELVIWRTGIHMKTFNTICLHHRVQYLDKFTILNPFCCDPFRHHEDKMSNKGNFIGYQYGKLIYST